MGVDPTGCGVGGDAMHAMIYEWRSLSMESKIVVGKVSDDYEQLWQIAIGDAVACGLLKGDAIIIRKQVLGGLNVTVRWYKPDGRLTADRIIDEMLYAALPSIASRVSADGRADD